MVGDTGGSFQTQLFLRAIDALLDHRLFVPDGFSTYCKVWNERKKKKKKVWSTKLAVLLVVQISSAEEQTCWILRFRSEVPKTNDTQASKKFQNVADWKAEPKTILRSPGSRQRDSVLMWFPLDHPPTSLPLWQHPCPRQAKVSAHVPPAAGPGPEGLILCTVIVLLSLKNMLMLK